MKNKIVLIKLDIIKVEIPVCVGVSRKCFNNWLDRNDFEKEFVKAAKALPDHPFEIDDGGYTIEYCNKEANYWIIFLEDYDNTWKWANILLHEVVHLKQYLFRHREITDEDEFEAYFIETTFNKIAAKLDKKVNK